MKKDNLLKMHLQMFADKNPDAENLTPDDGGDDQEKPDANTEDAPEKKYTDEDVNALIDKKFAKWQKDLEKEKEDAARKAKLSEKDRLAEEKSDLEKKIEEYERKEKLRENAKIASKKLSEASLPHDDDLIDLITNDDESITQEAVNIVLDYVSKIKKQNTIQGTPSDGGTFGSGDNMDNKSKAEMAKKKRII